MRVALVEGAIDVAALTAELSAPEHGATAIFLGTVRAINDNRVVTGIDYSAYTAMAESEMLKIAREAARKFGVDASVIEHRVGYLEVGDVSVAILAAHARRRPAVDAVSYVIEELKQRVPIWKREHYADGGREWVHAGTLAGATV